MAKRQRIWNETKYRRYIKEGRGQGDGAKYIPWIMIQDFPSLGIVSRVKGSKTGRIHHFLSNNEMRLFFILDWSDEILDIREQYPLLELSEVIDISEKARINYPYDNKSGFPYVLTSDFYLNTTSGAAVISVKTISELENLRVREKLEIERRYWTKRGVKWQIVTEREINQTKAANIEWLSQAGDLACAGIPPELFSCCCGYFIQNIKNYKSKIGNLIDEIEKKFGLSTGIGLNIYKYLAYRKMIDFDADRELDFSTFTVRRV